MNMTHYMELLASNQPWNLIFFMAIPVILAETVAISELYILFTGKVNGAVVQLSRFAGIFGGVYFVGVFVYLFSTVVLPLTQAGEWRWIADIIAVGFYLLGVVPLVGIALADLNIIGKNTRTRQKCHAVFVGIFLVVAHIAMIFGMLSPSVFQHYSTETPLMMDHNM